MGQYLQLLETVSKIKLLEERLFEELSIEDLIFLSENGRKYLTEGLDTSDIDYNRISPEMSEELKKNDLTPQKIEEIFREKIGPHFAGEMNFGRLYYASHSSERAIVRNVLENISELADTLALFFKDYGRELVLKTANLPKLEIAIEDAIPGHKHPVHPVISYDTMGKTEQDGHKFLIMTLKPSPFTPNNRSSRNGYIPASASVPKTKSSKLIRAQNGVPFNRNFLQIYR